MFWLVLVLIGLVSCDAPDNGYFLFKHSVSPPFGMGQVPYWDQYGSTIIKEDHVSLTPNEKDRSGQLWNREPLRWKNWEVQIKFVVGSPRHYGADGWAFWYTRDKGGAEGSAFGSADTWRGLGIMFDTYDNDGTGSHPAIYAVKGDGINPFDHHRDGADAQLAHCLANFRHNYYDPQSQHKTPYLAKIRYVDGMLRLDLELGATFQNCFTVPVALDAGGYFGLSAATGGITDYHDIVSLQAYSFADDPVNSNTANQWKPQQNVNEQQREPEKPVTQPPPTRPQASVGQVGSPGAQAFMNDVVSRQIQFSVQLEDKFVSFAKRLSDMDHDTNQQLTQASEAIGDLKSRVALSKQTLETLKSDIQQLNGVVSELTSTLSRIQLMADETAQATESQVRDTTTTSKKAEEVLTGHSTGFWVFFVLFQVFFVANMFASKKTTDAARKRF